MFLKFLSSPGPMALRAWAHTRIKYTGPLVQGRMQINSMQTLAVGNASKLLVGEGSFTNYYVIKRYRYGSIAQSETYSVTGRRRLV